MVFRFDFKRLFLWVSLVKLVDKLFPPVDHKDALEKVIRGLCYPWSLASHEGLNAQVYDIWKFATIQQDIGIIYEKPLVHAYEIVKEI